MWGIDISNYGYFKKENTNDEYIESCFDQDYVEKYFKIIHISSGLGYLKLEDRKYIVKKGEIVLIYKGSNFKLSPLANSDFEKYWVEFDSEIEYQQLLNDLFPTKESRIIKMDYNPFINKYFKNLISISDNLNIEAEKVKSKLVLNIILEINTFSDKKKDNDQIIKEIKNLIQNNLIQDLNLEEIASSYNLSVSHLRLLFKQKTKKPILRYQIELKLKESKELLLNSNKNIKVIAELCGFNSSFYFSRLFKKYENGLSPSEFREKYKLN